MKEKILKILSERTEYQYLYNGGGNDTEIVAIKNSEGWDKDSLIEDIANEIIAEIEKEKL